MWDDKSSDATWELKKPLEKPILISFLVSQILGKKIYSCWGECKDLENSFREEVVYLK